MNKRKTILLISILILGFGIINAQKIKLKKNKVFLDDKEIFNYEKRNWNTEVLLYPIEGEREEVIYMEYNNNETIEYREDDYIKIQFVQQNISLESTKGGSWKRILKWMFQNKVFDSKGNLNDEKVKKFVERYDQNITNRTIRIN